MTTQVSITKKLLLASLATVALSLSACADNAPGIDEPEAMESIDDAQTPVEQEATGVDDVEQVVEDVNSVDIDDDPLAVDPMAEDDMTIVTTDDIADSEILDGTETQENISTY